MKIKELIEFFSSFQNLPVEISDIRDHLVEHGIQDKIIFGSVDINPAKLRGLYHQYIEHDGVYSEPQRVSLVLYSKNLPIDHQRLVCGKELVHILDEKHLVTKSYEQLYELTKDLLRPLDQNRVSSVELQVIKEELAVWQALAILFPHEKRETYLQGYKAGEINDEFIAYDTCIPVEYIPVLMSDEWDAQRETIMSF